MFLLYVGCLPLGERCKGKQIVHVYFVVWEIQSMCWPPLKRQMVLQKHELWLTWELKKEQETELHDAVCRQASWHGGSQSRKQKHGSSVRTQGTIGVTSDEHGKACFAIFGIFSYWCCACRMHLSHRHLTNDLMHEDLARVNGFSPIFLWYTPFFLPGMGMFLLCHFLFLQLW